MVHAWTPGAGTAGRRPRNGRLSLSGVLTLSAISLVVVLVSLPRLHGFALRENESDAVRMLQLLGRCVEERDVAAAERPDLCALVRGHPLLLRRLEDCQTVGGTRLLRHGYLFEAFETAPGRWALRSWPWRYGQTGRCVFVWSPETGVRSHPNREALCSGPDAPPAWPGDRGAGWRQLAQAPAE
jgi:hypothetical protein